MKIQFLTHYQEDLFGIDFAEDEIVELPDIEAQEYIDTGVAIPAPAGFEVNEEAIRRKALYQTRTRIQI